MKIENLYAHPAIIFYRTLETECIKRVMKNVKIKSPSLDLGCGDGKITNYLFGKTFNYGLDNDEVGDVKIAKKNKIYKKILIEDATNISLRDDSINFIFSNSVLEHIPNLSKVLSEISRILNKNGYFLISVPTDGFKKNLFFSNPIYSYFRNKLLNHHHLYNLKKWTSLLKKNKLKIIKYKYCVSKEQLKYWDKLAIFHRLGLPCHSGGALATIESQYSKRRDPITSFQGDNKALGKQVFSNLVILAKKI
jgi:SAM-dependent methyltransferase